MAICEISGKGKMYGHNVNFSQHKTRKVFKPNIKKTLISVVKNLKSMSVPQLFVLWRKKVWSNNLFVEYNKIDPRGLFLSYQ